MKKRLVSETVRAYSRLFKQLGCVGDFEPFMLQCSLINLNLQMKETGVLGVLGRAWMSVDIPKSTETGHVSPILNSNMTIVHLCVLVTTPRWWTAMLDVVLVSTVRSLHREMQLFYFNCTMYRIRKKHSLKCPLFTPTCFVFRREAYE